MTIIASGATTSAAINVSPNQASLCVEFPSAMTGTEVAVYSTLDGTNYRQIYNDGIPLVITFVASTIHVIPPYKTYGLKSFKLVSNGAEAAEREIKISIAKVV